MAHTFQLVTPDGEQLGTVELARPDWPPGSVIVRGRGKPNLRVVEHLPARDLEWLSTLVVAEEA